MTELKQLTDVIRSIAPSQWETVASQPSPDQATYFFEWRKDNKRVGGLAIEVQSNIASFLGLEVNEEGQNVFRGLCRALPKWAQDRGIDVFVVPFAQSEQMRTLLADAGFNNIGANAWETNVAETTTVEDYGKRAK